METPYDYTNQGKLEAWARKFVPGFRRDADYCAWLELVGVKRVNRGMAELVRSEKNV